MEVRKIPVATHRLFSLLSSSFKMFAYSILIIHVEIAHMIMCMSCFVTCGDFSLYAHNITSLPYPQTLIGSRNDLIV